MVKKSHKNTIKLLILNPTPQKVLVKGFVKLDFIVSLQLGLSNHSVFSQFHVTMNVQLYHYLNKLMSVKVHDIT